MGKVSNLSWSHVRMRSHARSDLMAHPLNIANVKSERQQLEHRPCTRESRYSLHAGSVTQGTHAAQLARCSGFSSVESTMLECDLSLTKERLASDRRPQRGNIRDGRTILSRTKARKEIEADARSARHIRGSKQRRSRPERGLLDSSEQNFNWPS